MNQFGTIFKFEFKSYLTNKVFVVMTVFFALLFAAGMFVPRILSSFEVNSSESEYYDDTFDGSEDISPDIFESGLNAGFKDVMLVSCPDSKKDTVSSAFSIAFPQYNVVITEKDLSEIEKKIKNDDASCAVVINDDLDFSYYVNNLSMYDSNAETVSSVLKSVYQSMLLEENGIDKDTIASVLGASVSYETVLLGKNQIINYLYTYIMIFALYMSILLYGQMVAQSVATEKSSRAMELLITSANPSQMMFGKVFAACLAGFSQLFVIFGTTFVCFQLNKQYWASMGFLSEIFNIPAELIVYMLVFFILGFLVYAFLYGAVGSTVSKLEDINTAVMPLTFLFIIGFMIVVFSLSSNEVDTVLLKVCSYIPFTSPMAMFTRIAMSNVEWYEIAASIALLCVAVIIIGIISARIYRIGVLLYGTPPKPAEIIKALKNSNK